MATFSILYLAKKNIKRRFFRTFVTIISVSLAVALFFTGSLLIQGVNESLRIGVDRMGADILVVPQGAASEVEDILLLGKPTTFYMDEEILDIISSIQGVKQLSPQLYIVSLIASCCIFGETMLIGFDPETEFSILSWLSQKLDRNLEPDDVIVGHYIISPLGSPLQFYGHEFNIGGKLEPTGIGLDKTVFIQIEDARKMIRESADKAIQKLEIEPNQISSILIRVDRSISTIPEVALKIQASVPGVSVIPANKLIEGTNIQISSATNSLLLLTPAILAISTMTVFTFFSMIINERQREIGLLRAIGASRLHIFQLILIEAILLTMIGSIVGVIVGGSLIYGFISYFIDILKVPYLWPSGSYIIILAFTSVSIGVLTGILGALYPSIRSSIKDPLSAIRRE